MGEALFAHDYALELKIRVVHEKSQKALVDRQGAKVYKALSMCVSRKGHDVVAVVDDKNCVFIVNIASGDVVETICSTPGVIADGIGIALNGSGMACATVDRSAHRIYVHRRSAATPKRDKFAIFEEDRTTWMLERMLGGICGNGEGQLHGPVGLTWYGDELLVADSANNRIVIFGDRTETQSLTSKRLKRPSDVAAVGSFEEEDMPDWWLGRASHDETVHAMRGCRVGEWRVRVDGSDQPRLCYVSKSAWNRADIDEKVISKYQNGYCVKVQAEVAERYLRSTMHPGIEYDVPVPDMWTALRLCAESIGSLVYPFASQSGYFEGRRYATVAVSSRGNDRLIFFEYARRVGNRFPAKYRFAGERRGFRSPRSVCFTPRFHDLVVGLEIDMSMDSRSPGQILVLGAPSYRHRVATYRLDRTYCDPGAPLVRATAESLVFLAGDSIASRLVMCDHAICRRRDCGDFSACSGAWVANVAEYLGYAHAAVILAPACHALKLLFFDLRKSWRLPPFTTEGLTKARHLFMDWAREVTCKVTASRRCRPQWRLTPEAIEANRLRSMLARYPARAYALHAHSTLEVCSVFDGNTPTTTDRFLDFCRGVMCCVTTVYGPKFWWRWRGHVAKHYAELATELVVTERLDDKPSQDPRRPLRSTFETKTLALDFCSFIELWTRIEEHVRAFRPWPTQLPSDFASSRAARLMACQTNDSLLKIRRAMDYSSALDATPSCKVALLAHLEAYDYFRTQTANLINRATLRPLELGCVSPIVQRFPSVANDT